MHISNVCSKCFRCFHIYVASVLSGCCKTRSVCCICCYGYTCIFQVYVSSVSSRMLQMFLLDVSKVDHVAMAPLAGRQRSAIAACYCCWGDARGSQCRHLGPAHRASAGGVRRARGRAPVCYGLAGRRGNGPPVTRARQARVSTYG
jgi:hypothetical protein